MATWIEIFKTGKHTASNGATNEFDNSKLNLAVKNFPGEAPVIIGHSKPNYELTKIVQLKNEGGILKALLSDENIESFQTLARTGLNRISAGFKDIANMVLDHVALLGATPQPALKDLIPIKFNQSDCIIYDSIINKGDFMADELAITKDDLKDLETSVFDKITGFFKSFKDKETPPPDPAKFSAEDIQKMINTSTEEATKALSTDFQAKIDVLKEENTKLQNSLGNSFQDSRTKDFNSFLDSKELEKKMTPAIKTRCLRMFNALDVAGELEYSQDDKTIKTTPLAELKLMITELPDQIAFDEFAVDGSVGNDQAKTVDAAVELYNKSSEVE